MEREDYPSFQLEYPMTYDGTYSDGRFLWDTSAGTTQRTAPATGEERVWRGDSLEDIADFYRGQLAALGATGEEGSGEDSWSFTGSYSGGKIEIQVTPNGDGYRISCTIDQPVDSKTLFQIASCSKAFTTMVAGQLCDEGKMTWDTPVKQLMPDFQMVDKYAEEHVTPRDMGCHRTGLCRHDVMRTLVREDRADLVRRIA